MSIFFYLKALDEHDKSEAVKKLITDSTPDFDFFLLTTLSILMATIGLLINSPAVIIGSMLIAPLLSPILSISLGVVMSDYKLITRSLYTLTKATFVGIAAALIVTWFLGLGESSITSEVLARTEASSMYLLVALISGFAASYTLVRPDLSAALPGVAVAVALIPPVAAIGIGVATLDMDVVRGATKLFLLNVSGIVAASLLVYSLMDLYGKRRVARQTIKKEERRLEEEKEEQEEMKENEIK